MRHLLKVHTKKSNFNQTIEDILTPKIETIASKLVITFITNDYMDMQKMDHQIKHKKDFSLILKPFRHHLQQKALPY